MQEVELCHTKSYSYGGTKYILDRVYTVSDKVGEELLSRKDERGVNYFRVPLKKVGVSKGKKAVSNIDAGEKITTLADVEEDKPKAPKKKAKAKTVKSKVSKEKTETKDSGDNDSDEDFATV